MKSRLRKNKNGNGNRQHLHGSTPENTVSTSKVSTSNGRFDIRIPKNSQIYKFLDVDNTIIKVPIWKRLDALLAQAEKTQEDIDTQIFDMFVSTFSLLHPEKRDKLKKLRGLVLWHILWDEPLNDEYFNVLRNI